MNSLSQGMGGDHRSIVRRLERAEALLKQFTKKSIVVDTPEGRRERINVLSQLEGPGVGVVATVIQLGALVVTVSRPAFIKASSSEPPKGTRRIWVTYGTINSKVATNLTDHFDIHEEKSIYAKANFTTSGGFAVKSWAIELQATDWSIPADSGPRPSTGYFQLGSVYIVDKKLVVATSGSGSLTVWPQISNSLSGTTADTFVVWRR